jgi:hypothetical protein
MAFVLAGAIMIAVPLLFYFGQHNSLKCHAASILFATSLILAGAIPSNAAPLLFFEPLLFFQPVQSLDCHAAIYSFSWCNSPVAALHQNLPLARTTRQCRAVIFFWPAQSGAIP